MRIRFNKKNLQDENPYHNPDDYGFIKDIPKKDNRNKRISEIIGTPVHIGFLRMAERDERRHRTRCTFYDKKEKYCTYYANKCYGASHCKLYKEK